MIFVYKLILYFLDITSLEDVMNVDFVQDSTFSALSSSAQFELQRAARTYKDSVVLEEWLKEHGLEKYLSRYTQGLSISCNSGNIVLVHDMYSSCR